MHIYAVINQKGGVGKTTTVSALTSGLKLRGRRVLAVDLDPQGNLSYSFGAEPDGKNALAVLTGELSCADAVVHAEQGDIIPAQADIYSIQGIGQLGETIVPVKKYCNSGLYINGILLTRYNPRAVLSRDVVSIMEEMAEKLDTKVFDTKIREAVSIREAQMLRQDIYSYAAKSNVAADYNAFVDELLEKEKK